MGGVLASEAEKDKCRIFSCVDTSNEDINKGNVFINSASSGPDKVVAAEFEDVLLEPNKDRRKLVNGFKDSDMHSGIVKLKMTFPADSPDADDYVCFGTGQIMNMVLSDGSLSEMFIQTAAHNFIIKSFKDDFREDSFKQAKSVTAYFHVNGEDDEGKPVYEKAIPVIQFRVYDKFFENPYGDSGYDYAVASIKFDPEEVAVQTLTGKFTTLPALAWRLAKGHNIVVSGFPGEEKNRHKLHEMKGTIYKIHKTDDDHALIVYKDIDTTTGQSGAMVCLVEETSTVVEMLLEDNAWAKVKSYVLNGGQWATETPKPADRILSPNKTQVCNTNVGVHSMVLGGINTVNVGTLLTPSIIEWTREQITSGNFWEKAEFKAETITRVGCEALHIGALKKGYKEALVLNQEDAQAWINLGKMGGGMKKSKKQCFEKALELDDENIEAWRGLGRSGGGLGRSKYQCDYEAQRLEKLREG